MASSAARFLAAAVIGIGGSATIAAPAGADPQYHNGTARSIIDSLRAEGYNVVINWLNGFNTKSLDVCTVTNINDPDSSPPPPGAFTTVYVDVSCPNHDYD